MAAHREWGISADGHPHDLRRDSEKPVGASLPGRLSLGRKTNPRGWQVSKDRPRLLGFPFLRHFCHSEPQFEIVATRAVYKIEARELFGPMRLFGDQMRDGRCRQFGLKTEFAGTVTA